MVSWSVLPMPKTWDALYSSCKKKDKALNLPFLNVSRQSSVTHRSHFNVELERIV